MAAPLTYEVHGTVAPGFEPVAELARQNLESGADIGFSLCVLRGGQTVVDLWGGLADPDAGIGWQRDTIVNTYSVTKTMTALCALLLVDAGELDLDNPVAHYWPEFAANGKQDVLVRHLLGHTSGVAGWQEPVSVEDICDVPRATELLAAQEPWWRPGDGSGYHAINQGHLVGEVVRRVSGRSLGTFFADELARPLGADFFIGTPADADGRVGTLVAPESSGIDYSRVPADSFIRRVLLNPGVTTATVGGSIWRRAEIGAANGHGNARAVATIQSLVATGEAGPLRLSRGTRERIFEVQADGVDRVLMAPLRFGTGYALPHPRTTPEIPAGRTCWWTGFGGSLVVNDLDRELTFAYVMNRMDVGLIALARAGGYLRTVYGLLDNDG